MLNGDYLSMAEACGEYTRAEGYVFFPGEDFDPSDEDDVAAVMAAGEWDVHARARRLAVENEQLRARIAEMEDYL